MDFRVLFGFPFFTNEIKGYPKTHMYSVDSLADGTPGLRGSITGDYKLFLGVVCRRCQNEFGKRTMGSGSRVRPLSMIPIEVKFNIAPHCDITGFSQNWDPFRWCGPSWFSLKAIQAGARFGRFTCACFQDCAVHRYPHCLALGQRCPGLGQGVSLWLGTPFCLVETNRIIEAILEVQGSFGQ